MKMTGAELIMRLLERQGIETIAGVPGGANLPLYDALRSSRIRHVLARHEQGAGFIAQGLARATGRPARFVGFHVFSPVDRMKLVELAYPQDADPDTKARAWALCESIGKTPVEVPDTPGFVVNRLLVPYLLSAVELMTETGLSPEAVDQCMSLGAGMPIGPIGLLDFIGLDVVQAAAETIGSPIPEKLAFLVEVGDLGRKSGRGFYNYD